MGTVILREHFAFKRDPRGDGVVDVPDGVLVTDAKAYPTGVLAPIKTVPTAAGVPTDSPALDAATNFVEIESDVDVRYCVRPKGVSVMVPATAQHAWLQAGPQNAKIIAVYGSAIINFLE